MFQPTGSVYLDAPRPSRRPAPTPARGPRTILAGFLLCIGFLGLTVGVTFGGARVVLRDPTTLADAIDTSLDDRLVQDEIEQELASAIESSVLGESSDPVVNTLGIDVSAEALRLAPLILADPAFQSELSDLIVDGHARVLLDPTVEPMDLTPLTATIVTVIATESPDVARLLPPGSLIVSIESDTLPDLTGPMTTLDQIITSALLISLAIPVAAVIHPRRHRVLAWSGRWLLTTGFMSGLAAVGLPYLAGNLTGYVTIEIVVRALTVRLLGPAALAGILGMAMVSVAAVLKSRERRRLADEGAAAALGVNEPMIVASPTNPHLDLAQRGLVDVNHPLTNI